METAKNTIIFYTNYGAVLKIAKQIILFTSFIDKFNLRFIRASNYIQKFSIVLKHKFGKQHIIFDVLFCVPTDNNKI